MVIGVGVDFMRIDRICGDLADDDPFIRRGFTQAERDELSSRSDRRTFLATRFSAKEAVFKTLHCDGNACPPHDVEILSNEIGEPYVNLFGRAAEAARRQGIGKVLVSLSYDDDHVVAFAVAEALHESHD